MRKWFIFLILLAVLAILGYNYIYKDHRDIATERSEFNLTATILANDFSNNAKEAESKYLNKTITVTGTISEIDNNSITINDLVVCLFKIPITNNLNINSPVEMKGRVIGYDDLLEQVKLDQCSIVKPN